jgi:hypothetical protein
VPSALSSQKAQTKPQKAQNASDFISEFGLFILIRFVLFVALFVPFVN